MVIAKKRPAGCWTCRLRRKRCDTRQPICGLCKDLEIDCHFSSERPEWMISVDKQRDMAEKIKCKIKQTATSRRERSKASSGTSMNAGNTSGTSVIDFLSERICMESDSTSGCRTPNLNDPSQQRSTNDPTPQTPLSNNSLVHDSSSKSFAESKRITLRRETALSALDHLMDGHICSAFFSQHLDYETDFTTKYLDYVFPSLFPFYRPSVFETGRSWLLSLLKRSRIAFHSALSLTSYFFTIALTDAYDNAYSDCTDEIWGRLEDQTNMCFEMIRTNMAELNLHDTNASVLEKVHAMESIVQLLLFEVVLGRSADWDLHLVPALTLFEGVVSGANSHSSKMISILHNIGTPSWFKAEFNHYMWNPDQAGFRFFATLLVFIDVIASTALAQPPRLAPHHSDLLDDQDDGSPVLGFTLLRLSTMIGCQNSVIVAIGQIATLESWKQAMKLTGMLSIPEMAERAKPISASLRSTLDALDSGIAIPRPPDPLNLSFLSYAVRANASSSSTLTTRIWTHAAQLYLYITASGWQPSHIKVRSDVSRIFELLSTVPSNHLRTLAWPTCVAGCLASADQEQGFRDLFSARKKLEVIGSLRDAQRVMEKVWERRDSINPETWDLVACFNVLEKPVLLI